MTPLPAADSLSGFDADVLRDGAADVRYAMETYGELRPARDTEWLLTNGLGGYACGTVAQVATRRYHALLVAATLPPVGRVVLLSRLAEVLVVDGESIDLSGAYFRDKLTGEGPALLRRFELAGDVAQWELDYDATKIYKGVVV
ncbi:MAG: glycogen debranching enzyme N-terminal domain-containing protein [Planctomycetota bacterium]